MLTCSGGQQTICPCPGQPRGGGGGIQAEDEAAFNDTDATDDDEDDSINDIEYRSQNTEEISSDVTSQGGTEIEVEKSSSKHKQD